MTIEEKYNHALLVLHAIAQRKTKMNEWDDSQAFYDCNEAARRCLLKLEGEYKELKPIKNKTT